MDIHFIDNPEFHEPDAEETIIFPLPVPERQSLPPRADPFLRMLAVEPLSKSQQMDCFRMLNYLKFRASLAEGQERQNLLKSAGQVRDLLCITNQRFVAFILARRLRRVKSIEDKLAIMSDGNLGLVRAIERYDYGSGFSFMTYAGKCIMRPEGAIVNHAKRWARIRQFGEYPAEGPGDQPESVMSYVESREPLPPEGASQREYLSQLRPMLKRVHPSKRKIVEAYLGIDGPPQTMGEIGEALGISTSRVSQLFRKAVEKMSKCKLSQPFTTAHKKSQTTDEPGNQGPLYKCGRGIPDWLLIVWDQARIGGLIGSMPGWRRDFEASSKRLEILTALVNRFDDSLSIDTAERGRILSTMPGWLLEAWNAPEDDQMPCRWTSQFERCVPATRRKILIELLAAEAEIRGSEIASYDTIPNRESGRVNRSPLNSPAG